MKALPPKVHVSFGTPDQAFYNAYKITLKNSVPYEGKHDEVSFIQQGYSFTILHTPNLHADIPSKLNLPLSI